MIEIVTGENRVKWNNILSEFPLSGTYYTYEYCKAFKSHGDGTPKLILFQNPTSRLKGIMVMMVRDVGRSRLFCDVLSQNEFYDAVTPYGYGGFIFNRPLQASDQKLVSHEFKELLSNNGIISLFVRFNPVLGNADDSRNIFDVVDLGHTVAMELDTPELIWSNLTSKNRNVIRKAEKSGVVISHGKGTELMEKFIPIYESTMDADNAEDYYYFGPAFYDSITKDMKDNHEIFYAEYDGKIISMAIMLHKNSQMEYHLSGSLREFRNLGAGNLLLYKAALWGHDQGFKTFHLGGGVGSGEDSLFKFKAAFNRYSDYRFSIGKLIVDKDKYNFLVEKRIELNSNFNINSTFFPLYRS